MRTRCLQSADCKVLMTSKITMQPSESDTELHCSDHVIAWSCSVNSDSWFTLLNEHLCLLPACFIKWLPQLPLPSPLPSCSSPRCALWACAPSLSTTDEGRWPELVGGWDIYPSCALFSFCRHVGGTDLLKRQQINCVSLSVVCFSECVCRWLMICSYYVG